MYGMLIYYLMSFNWRKQSTIQSPPSYYSTSLAAELLRGPGSRCSALLAMQTCDSLM